MLWVAEPFVGFVYGEQWLPAAEPLEILAIAGFFYVISRPCGILLMAQNRLLQEMVAQTILLIFAVSAVIIGLNWGLAGVSWGILATQVFQTIYYYVLVYNTIPTRLSDLLKAVAPGLALNSILYLVLIIIDSLAHEFKMTNPGFYLLVMAIPGLMAYAAAFFLIPIPSLKTEVALWREKINGGLAFVYKSL